MSPFGRPGVDHFYPEALKSRGPHTEKPDSLPRDPDDFDGDDADVRATIDAGCQATRQETLDLAQVYLGQFK